MKEFLSVAICVIVSLVLLAITTRYLSGTWVFATIQSLQLHLTIASAAALFLALLLKRSRLPFGLLLVALSLLAHALWMSREYTHSAGTEDVLDHKLKLLSFNILMTNFEGAQSIRDLILSSGVDVVNIMEAEPLQPHLQELSKIYPYRIGCGEMTKHCDLMMLSKLPLVDRTIASLSDVFAERMMVAKLTFEGQPFHLVALHTTKPYFDSFQTLELQNAAQLLDGLPGPVILSGDFNASTLARNVRTFLASTGLRSAPREPATWPTRAGWAGVAIDHVFVRPPLAIASLQRLPDALGSNHYGLVTEITFPKN